MKRLKKNRSLIRKCSTFCTAVRVRDVRDIEVANFYGTVGEVVGFR